MHYTPGEDTFVCTSDYGVAHSMQGVTMSIEAQLKEKVANQDNIPTHVAIYGVLEGKPFSTIKVIEFVPAVFNLKDVI